MKKEIMDMVQDGWIPAFKTGTHKSMEGNEYSYSEAELDEIAQSYDNKTWEAPLVIGHPTHDAPAYGWIEKVKRAGEYLMVKPGQVAQNLIDGVRAGMYKNHSLSIYTRKHPANPTPGKLNIRHLGFLGGMAPAIKGLPQASFGEAEYESFEFENMSFSEAEYDQLRRSINFKTRAIAEMMRRMKNQMIEKEGLKIADEIYPEWWIDEIGEKIQPENPKPLDYAEGEIEVENKNKEIPKEETGMTPEEKKEFEAVRAENAELKAKTAQAETNVAKAEFASFCESGLIAKGALLPKDKDNYVTLALALAGLENVSYGEGDGKKEVSALEAFNQLLLSKPLIPATEPGGQFGDGQIQGKDDLNIDEMLIASNHGGTK